MVQIYTKGVEWVQSSASIFLAARSEQREQGSAGPVAPMGKQFAEVVEVYVSKICLCP